MGLPKCSSWDRWRKRQALPKDPTVAWICRQIRVEAGLAERLIELATRAHDGVKPTWYEEEIQGLGYTQGFSTVLELGEIACGVRTFAPILVPGLLPGPALTLAVGGIEAWLEGARRGEFDHLAPRPGPEGKSAPGPHFGHPPCLDRTNVIQSGPGCGTRAVRLIDG